MYAIFPHGFFILENNRLKVLFKGIGSQPAARWVKLLWFESTGHGAKMVLLLRYVSRQDAKDGEMQFSNQGDVASREGK
jgi:hypothetical protein